MTAEQQIKAQLLKAIDAYNFELAEELMGRLEEFHLAEIEKTSGEVGQ